MGVKTSKANRVVNSSGSKFSYKSVKSRGRSSSLKGGNDNNSSKLSLLSLKRQKKTVLESFVDSLEFYDVINEKNEFGSKAVLKYCTLYSKDKLFILYESSRNHRLRFDMDEDTIHTFNNTKGNREKFINYITEKTGECFLDKEVHDFLGGPLIKSKKQDLISGNIKKDTFADIESMLVSLFNGEEFTNWKRSKYAREYFCNVSRLQDMVDDDIAMQFFERFLAQQYSSENLDFYQAVKTYRFLWNPTNPAQSLELATIIVSLYISQESPLQVNIPSRMRVRLERTILTEKKAKIDVFKQASAEIVNLIARDAWPRFKRSPIWEEFENYYPVEFSDSLPEVTPEYVRYQEFHEFLGDDSLETVLASKIGKDCFGKFLNVVIPNNGYVGFWTEVNEYKRKKEALGEERKVVVQYIYDKYLGESSEVDVSISTKLKDEILSNSKNGCNLDIFDDAIHEIRHLFEEEDLFNKFKATALYTKYRMMVS